MLNPFCNIGCVLVEFDSILFVMYDVYILPEILYIFCLRSYTYFVIYILPVILIYKSVCCSLLNSITDISNGRFHNARYTDTQVTGITTTSVTKI